MEEGTTILTSKARARVKACDGEACIVHGRNISTGPEQGGNGFGLVGFFSLHFAHCRIFFSRYGLVLVATVHIPFV